jgi:uncharacterized membrane protein YhaH (DUF805 family)
MNWYIKVLKQYADFKGRARRTEYWMFVLFNIIFAFVAAFLDGLLGLRFSYEVPYGPIYVIYGLAVFIPGLAVLVRRLHDTNKSGWMFLVALIPLVGGIILLVFLASDGTKGENKYGPDPKNPNNEIDEIGK